MNHWWSDPVLIAIVGLIIEIVCDFLEDYKEENNGEEKLYIITWKILGDSEKKKGIVKAKSKRQAQTIAENVLVSSIVVKVKRIQEGQSYDKGMIHLN